MNPYSLDALTVQRDALWPHGRPYTPRRIPNMAAAPILPYVLVPQEHLDTLEADLTAARAELDGTRLDLAVARDETQKIREARDRQIRKLRESYGADVEQARLDAEDARKNAAAHAEQSAEDRRRRREAEAEGARWKERAMSITQRADDLALERDGLHNALETALAKLEHPVMQAAQRIVDAGAADAVTALAGISPVDVLFGALFEDVRLVQERMMQESRTARTIRDLTHQRDALVTQAEADSEVIHRLGKERDEARKQAARAGDIAEITVYRGTPPMLGRGAVEIAYGGQRIHARITSETIEHGLPGLGNAANLHVEIVTDE